jgi:hypothetical protein
MHDSETTLTDWLRIIRAEFAEFPGLHLTRPQMRRLWSLDEPTCADVIQALQSDGFLRQTSAGAYARRDS